MRKNNARHEQGVTLVELLVVLVIVSIAFFALAIPFASERSFWSLGRGQAGAQRDAQWVIRAISRVARESSLAIVNVANPNRVVFTRSCGNVTFEGGPGFNDGQLQRLDACQAPAQTDLLIDGVRSQVNEFTVTYNDVENLVRIQLSVENEHQRIERLETQIFLRNAT